MKRLVNPLVAFIAIQFVWIAVVISWIVWFARSHARLRALAARYSPELLHGGTDWFILVEGLVLLVAILVGVYVIFLYWRRQAALYRAQKNFIAQVSHELKSPLASLQLHLETIRRRRPSPEKMEVFLDTMLGDTDRLGVLINNLLEASRIEHRGPKLPLRPGDLSDFTSSWFSRHRYSLPRAGRMDLEITPGIRASFDPESMGTVFRNLLENAILYSAEAPQIKVRVFVDRNSAHLVITDSGKGIRKEEREKVFRMFYRVREGETIRGSGLGLFIVRTIVRLHRGKVWVESGGLGQGTSIHIRLPLTGDGDREEG